MGPAAIFAPAGVQRQGKSGYPDRRRRRRRRPPQEARGTALPAWPYGALLTNPDQPLPDDAAALQQLVRELLAEVRRRRQENEQLRQDIEQVRHRLDQALPSPEG